MPAPAPMESGAKAGAGIRPGSRPIGHPSPVRPASLDLDQRMAEATALAAPNPSSMTVPAGS